MVSKMKVPRVPPSCPSGPIEFMRARTQLAAHLHEVLPLVEGKDGHGLVGVVAIGKRPDTVAEAVGAHPPGTAKPEMSMAGEPRTPDSLTKSMPGMLNLPSQSLPAIPSSAPLSWNHPWWPNRNSPITVGRENLGVGDRGVDISKIVLRCRIPGRCAGCTREHPES